MENNVEDLEECRNCKHEVKKGIRRCQYCGILNPTVKTSDIFKTIFIIIFLMSVVTYIINNS